MSESAKAAGERSAPIFFDIFQSAFAAIDMTSSFWQPVLKGIGRSQMEFAGYMARQGQSAIAWQRAVSTAPTPDQVMNATARFWRDAMHDYASLAPRIMSAAAQVSTAVPVFPIIPMPTARMAPRRDLLTIAPDSTPHREAPERLVA